MLVVDPKGLAVVVAMVELREVAMEVLFFAVLVGAPHALF